MNLAKKQFIFQSLCCYTLSLGITVCFWMLEPSSLLPAVLLALVYTTYPIAECVLVWKRYNFQQTVLFLAPQKLFALIVSMLLCKRLHTISSPTPHINFDFVVFLFIFYVPLFIVPTLFTIMKKGIEEKTTWGKLHFGGYLFVLIVSLIFLYVMTWLLSLVCWQGYH